MTTPDPSSSLQPKLQTILSAFQQPHRNGYGLIVKSDFDEAIAQILQAFDEAGYVPLDLVRIVKNPDTVQALHDAGFQVSDIFDKPMMTGQEFYDSFKAELGFSAATRTEVVLKAARRAAGIEGTDE